MNQDVPPIYQMMPNMLGFLDRSPSLEALQSVAPLDSNHRRTQHKSTRFLVGFNRYGLHIVPCEI
jgi:hypothetical protein